MEKHGCRRIIYSSSAAVYTHPNSPIFEEHIDTNCGELPSTYAETKYTCEKLLTSLNTLGKEDKWNIVILRYFNPIGSHSSGLLGDALTEKSSNLMPNILRRVLGIDDSKLKIFGSTCNTSDGTPSRDFIHVCDVSSAHISVFNYIKLHPEMWWEEFNVGLGNGITVKKLVDTFNEVNGTDLEYEYVDKRGGDVEELYCSNKKILGIGWTPQYTLQDMCLSAYAYAYNSM
jgi:UDP-glucose 4-epimerase